MRVRGREAAINVLDFDTNTARTPTSDDDVRYAKLVYKESPESMAERVGRLLELGVNIIGGGCGTTPEHILTMRERIYAHADSTATD